MFEQTFDPVGGSLALSTIFAVLPLLTVFVLLGALKVKAQWASLAALAVALIVAIVVYGMPWASRSARPSRARPSGSSRSCGS